ncbi:DUF2948 family protein [Chthonobacter albigriseus]|uniref:DUF2948 family protein n=1 Tax=Chthonobacter albigriseus TaxID=1683161 RepID=UPI0015EFD3B5|nr:DUF2948 family protein [Chthonobacter albigriseus]
MHALKLAALDQEDLAVIAAHVQDAVAKVGDVEWHPKEKRFLVQLNRFVWEKADRGAKSFERRRACLHFARVEAVKATKVRQDAKDAVVDLLTIRFEETDSPAGHIYLELAGGGCVRLDVECIEASLTDLGAAWSTEHKPDHAI